MLKYSHSFLNQVKMARSKQVALKSTGGKVHRKELATKSALKFGQAVGGMNCCLYSDELVSSGSLVY